MRRPKIRIGFFFPSITCDFLNVLALTQLLSPVLISFVIAGAALTALAATTDSERSQKRVVVVYPTRQDAPVPPVMDRVYRKLLNEGLSGQLDLHTEYIDLLRFPEPTYQAGLHSYLSAKYKDQRIDLMITLWTPAPNQFMTRYRSELFPDTAVIYLLRDSQRPDPNSTGVYYDFDVKSTLELALKLQPETQRVFVIVGSSQIDKNYENRGRPQIQEFANRLEITYLTDLTMPELLERVAHLPPKSIILYQTITADRAGNRFITTEALDQITAAANAPVYCQDKIFFDHGIVGGHLMDYEAMAAKSAELALRVLHGENAFDIPITKIDPYRTEVDWRQLKRWGIDESRVPSGTIVSFRQPTFWQQYRWRIIGVITVILLQAMFIAVLLVERKRRRRAKESLDQLNAELEQRIEARTAALNAKSRELETFAYSVAHDLKAPLRGIDGYSRLLLEDHAKELNDEGRLFLDTIQASAEEMRQLIDDLLSYSRLERRDFTRTRVELQTLIGKLVDQKKREESSRRIDFVLDVNGTTVIADENGLTQSLGNYLDNAVKFTADVAQPRIEIGVRETKTNCLVYVRDNGIGFDPKYRDRIFGMFQRLNPAEAYPGTGVGLAIVRKAMERMGGRAWAESEPGHGATFYLDIPKNSGD